MLITVRIAYPRSCISRTIGKMVECEGYAYMSVLWDYNTVQGSGLIQAEGAALQECKSSERSIRQQVLPGTIPQSLISRKDHEHASSAGTKYAPTSLGPFTSSPRTLSRVQYTPLSQSSNFAKSSIAARVQHLYFSPTKFRQITCLPHLLAIFKT